MWTRSLQRNAKVLARAGAKVGRKVAAQAVRIATEQRMPPPGAGDWVPGLALGPGGARRYHLYRPPGVTHVERLPLLVMLHGCGQNAKGFALSTRMNRLAARERFLVLYPEQDMRAHPHGCWNWYDTRSGRAYAEAATLMAAIDQVTRLYPVDPRRVALVGLSAGASMAALMASRAPERFRAVVMHSGVPPGMAASSAGALKAMSGRRLPAAAPPEPGSPWPPLLVLHGTDDLVVSSRNAAAAAEAWAAAAGAGPGAPRLVQRGSRHPMRVTDYKARGRLVATLCEIEHLGHAWSGGDARQTFADAQGPDASRLAWAFAAKRFEAAGR